MARSRPTTLITEVTIALENPDNSITLPKIAPSMNTGKYSLTKPTIFSMKMPLNIGST